MRVFCSPEPAGSTTTHGLESPLQMWTVREPWGQTIATCGILSPIPPPCSYIWNKLALGDSAVGFSLALPPAPGVTSPASLSPNPTTAPATAITYVVRARQARGKPGAPAASVLLCWAHHTRLYTPK